MNTSAPVGEIRDKIREAIRLKFQGLVAQTRASGGSLSDLADQIGVKRQSLDQYADGSMPGADVLLLSLLKWDWTIRIETPDNRPAWCEFSLSDVDGGLQQRKREPIQLSLFEALSDLNGQISVLKKNVGRVEIEIKRAFGT